MASVTRVPPQPEIEYPDSDGKPMSDHDLAVQVDRRDQGRTGSSVRRRPQRVVAGNLLWYPVEGKPTIRGAPDVLLAFGRPKRLRGSYKQWEEGGIAPQVVFEVLSPGNRPGE